MGDRMRDKLKWFIAFVVIPTLAIIVPAWPQFFKPKKLLQYDVIAVSPLGPTQARGFADLRLLKGDKPIDEPYLATVRIFNSGDEPIAASDFATPIAIKALDVEAA